MSKTIHARRFEVDINDYSDEQRAELLKRIRGYKRINHYLVLDEVDKIIFQTIDKFSLTALARDLNVRSSDLSDVRDMYYDHAFNLIDLRKYSFERIEALDTDDQDTLLSFYVAELGRINKRRGKADVKH